MTSFRRTYLIDTDGSAVAIDAYNYFRGTGFDLSITELQWIVERVNTSKENFTPAAIQFEVELLVNEKSIKINVVPIYPKHSQSFLERELNTLRNADRNVDIESYLKGLGKK